MTYTRMTFRRVWQGPIATLPNGLSLARILLVPVLWVLIEQGVHDRSKNLVALVVAMLMVLTDALDGYVARRRGVESALGRYLDPLADKIAALSVLYLLVRLHGYPAWLAIFIAVREVVGLIAVSFLLFKRKAMGRPNLWGKAGIALLAGSYLFYLMEWPYKEWTVYPVAAAFAGGIVAYAATYRHILAGHG